MPRQRSLVTAIRDMVSAGGRQGDDGSRLRRVAGHHPRHRRGVDGIVMRLFGIHRQAGFVGSIVVAFNAVRLVLPVRSS